MDGFGGFDGGGFMGGTGFSPSTQSPAQSGRSGARVEHVTPVTVFQIKTAARATDDNFAIDGREVGQIMFVGIIRTLTVKSTKLTYEIEDLTGLVEVNQWMQADGDENAMNQQQTDCREGIYVRVFGSIRVGADDSSRRVTAFNVTPIDDMNEITHHMLYVLQTHLIVTQGHKNKHTMGLAAQGGVPMDTSGLGAQKPASGLGAATGGDYGMQAPMGDPGLQPEHAMVLKVITADKSDSGPSLHAIQDALRGKLAPNAVSDAIQFLCGEGHVYSTIDEEHFKSTDE